MVFVASKSHRAIFKMYASSSKLNDIMRYVINSGSVKNKSESADFDWTKSGTLNEMYRLNGYPHMVYANTVDFEWFQSAGDWCEDNTSGGWVRFWFRATTGYDGKLAVDEINGSDYIIFGFADETDAVHFALKWAGENGKIGA